MKNFKPSVFSDEITRLGVVAIIDFYSTIAKDQLQIIDDVFAFVTDVDSPFFNVVMDTRSERTNSLELIDTASNFFARYNVSWTWFVVPSSHDNDLTLQGFSLLEEAPAMYFDLSQPLPSLNADITIQEVVNNDDLAMWIKPVKEAFEAEEHDDTYHQLMADIFNSGSTKLRHFIAYSENNIVAAGTLFISTDSVMMHNLATKSAYTKRGIASALTIHMMQIAKQLGFIHCFLDSSENGFNMYQKIGFQVYSNTLIYSQAK